MQCAPLPFVMRRQLRLVEGSLREVLTKRRYVLRVGKVRFKGMMQSRVWSMLTRRRTRD